MTNNKEDEALAYNLEVGYCPEQRLYRVRLAQGEVKAFEIGEENGLVRMAIYDRHGNGTPTLRGSLLEQECAAMIVALGGCFGWRAMNWRPAGGRKGGK